MQRLAQRRTALAWGIREKLALLFFGVTLLAVSVNFVLVVPRLQTQLRGDRIKEMRNLARSWGERLQAFELQYDPLMTSPQTWQDLAGEVSDRTNARVTIFKVQSRTPDGKITMVPYGDSSRQLTTSDRFNDWVAARSINNVKIASGVVDTGRRLQAEAASPIKYGADNQAIGAVVFATSLTEANDIVKHQARRNLIAAIFALAISLLAGLVGARLIARRVRRLEQAARKVAQGVFTEPLPIDSTDELGELARAFNNMQERLGRADAARKAFIANASHELRTPLFSLAGYIELMREEDLDPQTQREFLETMHEQILRMTKLATDLLDLSKLDTGSLDISPENIDVEELARGIAREFEPTSAQHESEITVSAGEDTKAFSDPDRLAQIIRILVDNALSHTPQGTKIDISVARHDHTISVVVADDGPGITPEDLPRIFERFHTGDKTGGTGLGLSIAKEIAGAMNSDLRVDSSGRGTRFELRLPVAGRGR